jgi:hypothetical protein
VKSPTSSQPLDRLAMTVMAVIAIVTLILLLSGDRTLPQVRDFNWQNRQVSAEDIAFTLTFNRPVDRPTVEQQLRIDPPLPGKPSWAGSKMAYTLNTPAAYGNSYKLDLQGAREAIGDKRGKEIVAFTGRFQTPDRMLAYIGSEPANRGRIVIYNFQTRKTLTLTPENLVVTDFKIERTNQKIIFTATDTNTLKNKQPAIASQQIYSVTTGITPQTLDNSQQYQPPGNLEQILDNQEFQNIKFDLAPDGKKIVVQRVSRKQTGDFALWLVPLDKSIPPTKLKQSGDFIIAPDSNQVAASVGQSGVSIFSLGGETTSSLDFLPKYGNVLSFAADGSAAAMVEYNSDYTKSLFIVNNTGIDEQIFQTNGSIWDARFSPDRTIIYCLATELKTTGNNSREEPYLTAVDIKTKKILMMMLLPSQQGIQMSLSPDGIGLIFDRVEGGESTNQIVQGASTGILWLVPIPKNIRELTTPLAAERLPLSGWHPRWLN